jgi:hypothetical protein
MREPRRDHYIEPVTGTDTRAALDAALDHLARARNLDGTDSATAVHLLASLAAETEARMSEAISKARHDGCSWAGIADLLGVTRASAWQRWSRPQPEDAQVGRPAPATQPGPAKARTRRAGQNVTRSRSASRSTTRRSQDAKTPAIPRLSSRSRDQMSRQKG